MAKYLVKANDKILSHCRCISPLAAGPGQLDCPWCGCGWMISCMECGKAFVFAQLVEVDSTYEQLVRRDFEQRGWEADAGRIADGAAWFAEVLGPMPLGATVVYLDGFYLTIGATDVELEGDYANHGFDTLPHAQALENPRALTDLLGDPNYWLTRERADRED